MTRGGVTWQLVLGSGQLARETLVTGHSGADTHGVMVSLLKHSVTLHTMNLSRVSAAWAQPLF